METDEVEKLPRGPFPEVCRAPGELSGSLRVDERRDHLINAKLASDVRRIYAQFSNVKIKAGPFRVRLSHVGAGRPTITFQRGTCCNPAEISGGMRQPTSQHAEILRLRGSSDNATRDMSAMRDAARGASHVSHAA